MGSSFDIKESYSTYFFNFDFDIRSSKNALEKSKQI
jgi:hypothetical protein